MPLGNVTYRKSQCAIPAFEGLLPSPHNERVMKLLYTFGRWHGFAKMRMHTEHTVNILDNLTTQLGDDVRAFVQKTCSKIETKELAREYQARKRRQNRKRQTASTGANPELEVSPAPQTFSNLPGASGET